jgi:DNA repair protein RadC
MSEREHLQRLFGTEVAARLMKAPGGWRDLSIDELRAMDLGSALNKIRSLQALVQSGFPEIRLGSIASPDDIGRIYGHRLGGLVTEVMLAIAVDGRNRVRAEIEIARGGRHSLAVTPADVLRPVIRAGASAFILIHNHPSGNPEPSLEDVQMTAALSAAAAIVSVPLLDHVVVADGNGGFVSMLETGLLTLKENDHERSEIGSIAAEGQ